MKRLLRQRASYQALKHWGYLLRSSEYRRRDRQAQTDFARFRDQEGGRALRLDLLPSGVKPRTALIVGTSYLPLVKVEACIIKAFQLASFQTTVVGNRGFDFLRYYRLAGNEVVYDFSDFNSLGASDWVARRAGGAASLRDWMALEYEGIHVGRFAVASVLRTLKTGKLDCAKPDVQELLRQFLETSVRFAMASTHLLDKTKPDCVLVIDRGYAGQGEIFDLALQRRIDTLTWNVGYKSNRIYFKRYHSGNERDHPFSLSTDSWHRLCSLPWTPDYGRKIREELFQCYQTQDWFSVVGTQFNKVILSQQATRKKLNLSPDKKVAVIFPHILWDGSFFWGEDLFDNYAHWFAETMRAACGNSRLQWLVKLHPAHVVKNKIMKHAGRPAELDVIEGEFRDLPSHIKLIQPDTDISTYSLFEIADYVVTVRGTVGVEAALFGVPAVTAGTGRYDRRGFTLDSSTRQEYLQKLATLETYPRLSTEQIELAERFAYGSLLCRPLSLSSIGMEYQHDETATLKVSVHPQTKEDWMSAPDIRKLSDWIADGKAEDMLAFPQMNGHAAV